MSDEILLQLAGVLILGVAIQWFAWRVRLPAILLLLGAGLFLGPGSALLARWGVLSHALIDPTELFGNLLLPAVSLAVALVLFEGGLTLNLREHKAAGGVIWSLVTLGAGVTFGVTTLAAYFLLGLHWPLAVLLGAILVVTGPTVIGPLLRHVRPVGKVATVLKWEGIIIDPIGAMVAIVVFEALESQRFEAIAILMTAGSIILTGTLCGALGAGMIVLFFRRRWVPDFLHSGFVLVTVLLAFATANEIRHESGLFATTLMGLALANQRKVTLQHVAEFKESLTILLVSALFIVLGARLTLEQLAAIPWWRMGLFLLVLIVIARPLAVLVSTLFSALNWNERKFLAVMAPRGIVAAAVASVFALRLDGDRFPQAEMLVPITFATIIGTVTFYGLTASRFARKLGLTRPGNQGFLIAGAGLVERTIAAALQAEGQTVLLVDTSRENIATARLQGLPVLHGSVLSHFVMEEIQLAPIGRFLALTSNDEVNALAAMQYQRLFSRTEVYQLAPTPRGSVRQEKVSWEQRGRELFAEGVTYEQLEARMAAGQIVRRTGLTAEYTYLEFKKRKEAEALGLFVFTPGAEMRFFNTEVTLSPKAGDVVVWLGMPEGKAG